MIKIFFPPMPLNKSSCVILFKIASSTSLMKPASIMTVTYYETVCSSTSFSVLYSPLPEDNAQKGTINIAGCFFLLAELLKN